MRIKHNQKGITLVALVVTIIVLLILASVSINLVLGENGIITRAKQAKENTETASADELVDLNNLDEELTEEVEDLEPYTESVTITLSDIFTGNVAYKSMTLDMKNYFVDGKVKLDIVGVVEIDSTKYCIKGTVTAIPGGSLGESTACVEFTVPAKKVESNPSWYDLAEKTAQAGTSILTTKTFPAEFKGEVLSQNVDGDVATAKYKYTSGEKKYTFEQKIETASGEWMYIKFDGAKI